MRREGVRVAQEPQAVHTPGQGQVRARVRVRGAPDPKPNSDPNPDALGVERCDASELERERIVPRAGEDAAQMPLGREIFSGRLRVRSARQRELNVAATVSPHHLVRFRVSSLTRTRCIPDPNPNPNPNQCVAMHPQLPQLAETADGFGQRGEPIAL